METTCRYVIIFKEKYVHITFQGLVSPDKLIEASDEIMNSSRFTPGIPQIWEATHADLSEADGKTVEYAANELNLRWAPVKDSRVGLVSRYEINLSTVELFKEMYDRDLDNVRVFSTIEEAEEWVVGEQK